MRIHYLQHVPFENPGTILDWARKRGYPVTYTKLYENQILPTQTEFDWLVIMGGPMNIYEESKYPWLVREKEFIKAAIDNDKVLIGLCLGGQLISDVIGGRVIQNPHKEIGWFPITLTEAALSLPCFSSFPISPVVFEWHGDTFVDLPKEAVLLATNQACYNQAFVYRDRVFGFQFHLENTPQIINDLLENCADEMFPSQYVLTPEEIQSGSVYIEQDNALMNGFLCELEHMFDNVEG